ncbi:unnamed protein product [Discosporangium mesarthrocarpum]
MDKARSGLSINTGGAVDSSFDLTHTDKRGETFRKGGLEIHAGGVTKDGADHDFKVVYEDLELAELIGRGASSFVLRARHLGTNQSLALKVINLFDKSKRDQLITEINALYHADCPCLIKFFGAFFREGAITVVTEYMDGGSLANVGSIPEKALKCIMYQVLIGLLYLKQKKRVHRDIKPSNLLINSMGVVKVTDFGISSELQNSIAMCGTFVGTFKYMSPERLKGEKYIYSSDLWSLGLVLVECATNRYPYQEEATAIDLFQTIVEGPPPCLDGTVFSEELCQFVEHCLKKDPLERLPAEALLGSEWMAPFHDNGLHSATSGLKHWIDSLGS